MVLIIVDGAEDVVMAEVDLVVDVMVDVMEDVMEVLMVFSRVAVILSKVH